MIKVIVFTVITSILITGGQVLWKIGLHNINGFYLKEYNLFENIYRIIKSGYILTGFAVYVLATGFFMYLLSKHELSLIIPIMSISFIFALIAGIIFFHEEVNTYRWFGVVVIILGVYLITKS